MPKRKTSFSYKDANPILSIRYAASEILEHSVAQFWTNDETNYHIERIKKEYEKLKVLIDLI